MDRTRLVVWLAIASLATVAIAGLVLRDQVTAGLRLYRAEGAEGVYLRVKDRLPIETPNIPWEVGEPAAGGFDTERLNAWTSDLAARGTHALLLVRDNAIVHEFYSADQRPDRPHFIAAMGKLVTATMATMLAVADGRIAIDDPIASYIEPWSPDPLRSRVTVRHVLTHSSGIENVSFTSEHEGWKHDYLEHPARRFELVIETAPVRFSPGSRYEYSGVGFYALAYALGIALKGGPYADVESLLRERIMRPIDVPTHDWYVSYGDSYQIDGMRLLAIGSGGYYTPRALARVGQLLIDDGYWGGQQLLPAHLVREIFAYGDSPRVRSPGSPNPAAGLGVWLNCDGFWPDVPRDTAISAGGGHQVMVMIPSLDLVVVRLGEPLGNDRWEGDYWVAMGKHVLSPLIAAMPAVSVPAIAGGCGSGAT